MIFCGRGPGKSNFGLLSLGISILSANDLVLGSTKASAKALLININWWYTRTNIIHTFPKNCALKTALHSVNGLVHTSATKPLTQSLSYRHKRGYKLARSKSGDILRSRTRKSNFGLLSLCINILSANDLVLGSTKASAKALLININCLYTRTNTIHTFPKNCALKKDLYSVNGLVHTSATKPLTQSLSYFHKRGNKLARSKSGDIFVVKDQEIKFWTTVALYQHFVC